MWEMTTNTILISKKNSPLIFLFLPGSARAGAGTPQFQNLSGTIRTSANGLIPSTASNSSSASVSVVGSNQQPVQNGGTTPQNQPSQTRTTLTSLYHNSSTSNNSVAGSISSSSAGTTNQQDMNQTPSPSDSAVGDLETMLKEKDTEINYLRETMEQNEQVIFKVSLVAGLTTTTTIIKDLSQWFIQARCNPRQEFASKMPMMMPRLIFN